MKENRYDDPQFFEKYGQMPGLKRAWPGRESGGS